jgi:hypothetical protein
VEGWRWIEGARRADVSIEIIASWGDRQLRMLRRCLRSAVGLRMGASRSRRHEGRTIRSATSRPPGLTPSCTYMATSYRDADDVTSVRDGRRGQRDVAPPTSPSSPATPRCCHRRPASGASRT